MTVFLLFGRKIHSCFYWDCIVDANRLMGCFTEMILEKKLFYSKNSIRNYCTFGTVLATNLIQNEG
jgi:hypothetical protein